MSYGATAEDRKAFADIIAKDPHNKKCVDCLAPNPQWANVHHGVLICLECAGTHRGLGVHLSFVRSITMDAWKSWKPEKLMQMQKGGNGNALAFFQAKNVPGGTKDQIRARYNHIGAWMYREKLEASVEGRAFSEANFQPPPEYNPNWDKPVKAAPRAGYSGNRMGGLGSSPTPQKSGNNDTLNDGMKAMSAGLGKMQAVGWAVGSAVADASKKAAKSTGEAAKSVGESAKSVDTSNIQKSAGEGWATASAKATAGWGWLSSTVTKAASETFGSNDDGFGKIRENLDAGPVGEGDSIIQGETVVWETKDGPQKVKVAAVDDMTDPPTYILRLDDGGKRCAPHSALRKWSKYESDQSKQEATASSSSSPPPQEQPTTTTATPTREANPFSATPAKKPTITPKAKAPTPAKKDENDWDDWGDEDDSWGAGKKDD